MSQTQSCLFKIKENEEHARRNRILPEDRKYVPELDYLGKLPLSYMFIFFSKPDQKK